MLIMKKVLITGVSGFIGSNLIAPCIKKDWKVIGVSTSDFKFSHPDFILKKKDVRDLNLEDLKDIDYIFHLAFVTNIPNSITNPLQTTKDNIDMTVYLLDLATKAKIKKFVFPSTASLYGNNPTPWKEDMAPDPIEPYSWQKLSCEYACRMWHKCYGLPTVIFRLFQVFGENPRKDSTLTRFLNAQKKGEPLTLTKTNPNSLYRSNQRDFVYVKDVADAFIKTAESKKTGNGEIINIASGQATTIEEIAKIFKNDIKFIAKREYDVDRHEADIKRAKKILNWRPKVKITEWLKDYLEKI